MTQEDKELLLTDLCARLPYGVKVEIDGYNIGVLKGIDGDTISTDRGINYPLRLVKLYLRPMSSMTEEEKEELRQEQIKDEQLFVDCIKNHPEMRGLIIPHFAADWCDKNMFDYRGLIEKGLAIEAPDNMYKEERQ